MSVSKMIMGQAANLYEDPVYVENLFSTHLYKGTSGSLSINNGIDLSGEGGLVWTKPRDASSRHVWIDTVRGVEKYIASSDNTAEATQSGNSLTAFNNNGYTIGNWGSMNSSSYNYVSWTFRKQPKFFDIVTYTGTGSAQTISHNLGSVPGMIIVKLTSGSDGWHIYHRGLNGGSSPEDYYLQLNSTDGEINNASIWNDTAPTDSVFTVGTNGGVNGNGSTYVAYVFAHNNNDGGFGSTNDQDVIKCGSYTGNGSSTGPVVDIGFEPQFLLVKGASQSGDNWFIVDSMRGLNVSGTSKHLYADDSGQEYSTDAIEPTSTGFKIVQSYGAWNTNNVTYIYMAIRRGDMAVPTDATKVFAIATKSANEPAYVSNFTVDMALRANAINSLHDTNVATRLTGKYFGLSNSTYQFQDGNEYEWDYMDGWNSNASNDTNSYSWMWKRAPGYFDVVATKSTNGNVNHTLGVLPEMVWYKRRDSTSDWFVCTAANGYLKLNSNGAAFGSGNGSYLTNEYGAQVTATTVHTGYNFIGATTADMIIYLFATAPGVSKVGSYTGNGGTQNIDCGFSSGARFVLIKRSSNAQDWYIFDSTRGIVAGNDPYLKLNTTDAEATAADEIDPLSSGFTIHQTGSAGINFSGHTYIFYAIA